MSDEINKEDIIRTVNTMANELRVSTTSAEAARLGIPTHVLVRLVAIQLEGEYKDKYEATEKLDKLISGS